jgi:hypothetical protein
MKTQIYLPASKISSFCGGNKFKVQGECFFDAYKKNFPSEYIKLLKKLNREDKNVQNKFLLQDTTIQTNINLSIQENNTKSTNKTIRFVEKTIKEELTKRSIPEENQKVILNNVKTQAKYIINTSIGTNSEESSLNKHEQTQSVNITDRNDQLYTKIIETEKVKLKICGKIDGIDQETNTLIEHKQRVSRLFPFIPKYERIQMLLYMHITDTEHGKLIQTYNKEQTILDIYWSDDEWEKLITDLYKSLDKFYEIINSEKKLTTLVTTYTVDSLNKQKTNTIFSYF